MVQICQTFVNFVKFSSHDFFFQQNDAIVVQRGLNPLTLMGDQHRISPYNIKQTSDEKQEKHLFMGFLVDPTPNSRK